MRPSCEWEDNIARSSGNNESPTFLSYDKDSIENEINGGDTQTHGQQGDLMSLLLFLQNN
jgi:hypothetical protein